MLPVQAISTGNNSTNIKKRSLVLYLKFEYPLPAEL